MSAPNGDSARARPGPPTLTFLGAAGNVTGSRFLLDTTGRRVLIDCGLYQERQFAGRNWEDFPVPPASIDAVLLTHAHIDHSGYLPKLVRKGFRGPVYCTPATADLEQVLLVDSAHVQEEDAAYKKRRHEREGRRGPHPEIPLYTVQEARRSLRQLTPIDYETDLHLGRGLWARFRDAGHVLGSATIQLRFPTEQGERSITFSGDLGRAGTPILHDPAPLPPSDYVVVESTYGDRNHSPEDIQTALANVINATAARGGNIVIPAFALERAQEVLYHLRKLRESGRIPPLLTFVDSPMATAITRLFRHFGKLLDPDARPRGNRSPFEFPGLTFVRTVEESKAINQLRGSAIIIAGAGMCNGGRIKHHLVANIGRPESTVLFVGYQTVGTLGRHIVDGENPVRILGLPRQVRAKIERIEGFSSHAGQSDLLDWLTAPGFTPRGVFVVHGEAAGTETLATLLRDRTGWPVHVPAYGESAVL